MGPVVDLGADKGVTIPCQMDTECPAEQPTCHPQAKVCIGCIAGMDTCSLGSNIGAFVCDPPTHRCVARPPDFGCDTNSDCSGKTPVCRVAVRQCVECLSSNDCGGDQPFCDSFYPNFTGATDGFLSYTCNDGCKACYGDFPVCSRDQGVCCPAVSGGACVSLPQP